MKRNKLWKVLVLSFVALFAASASAMALAFADSSNKDEKNALVLAADTNTGVIGLQYDEKITLGENQYVEVKMDFENIPDSAVIDTVFQASRARTVSEMNLTEGVSIYADSGWLRGVLNSSVNTNLYSGWGNFAATNVVCGLQWVNGNAMLGASKASTHKYSMKTRIYDDGTYFVFMADYMANNWFLAAIVGYDFTNAWVKGTGIVTPDSGFATVSFRNAPNVTVSGIEVGLYDYTAILDTEWHDGTLVRKYVEGFDASTSLVKVISGTATKVTSTYSTDEILNAPVSKSNFKQDGATSGLSLTPDPYTGAVLVTYDEKLTLSENQYAEITYDLSGVANSFMDFKFMSEKASDLTAYAAGAGEGMMMVNDGRIGFTSQNTTKWRDGWGNDRDIGSYQWANFYNGNATLGINPGSDSLRMRVRIYANGWATYGFANLGQENWFNVAYIGSYNDGFAPMTSGYFQLLFRNTAAPVLKGLEVGVYSVTSYDFEAVGTLCGESYVEGFSEGSKTVLSIGSAEYVDISKSYAIVNDDDKSSFVEEEGTIAVADSVSGAFAYVSSEGISLQENQYVETIIDISGLSASPFVDFRYTETKPADINAIYDNTTFEGVSARLDVGGGVACAYSSKATVFMKAWNQDFAVDGTTYTGFQYANGNDMMGAPLRRNGQSNGVALVARYYYDGTFVMGFADEGKTNWFFDIWVGYYANASTNWTFVKRDGFKVMNTVYPQILIRSQDGDLKVNTVSIATYNLSNGIVDSNGVLNGTLDSTGTLQMICGSSYSYQDSYIVVKNAENDKVGYSFFTIPTLTESGSIEYSLAVDAFGGTGKAALYFGATDKALTGATQLTFAKNAGNTITLGYGEANYESTVEPGTKMTLKATPVDGGYAITLNGEDTGIVVTGTLTDTIVAFGTCDATGDNSATILYYGTKVMGEKVDVAESAFAPAIKPYPTALETPVITIDNDGNATWTAVEGASGYKYYVVGEDDMHSSATPTNVVLEDGQTLKVKALGVDDESLDSEYAEAEYTAPEIESVDVSGSESDPSGESQTTSENESGSAASGCFGSLDAMAALSVLLACAIVVVSRKKREN